MSISMKQLKVSMRAHAGACTLAALLAACGGGGDHHGGPPAPPPPGPAGLSYDVMPLSLGGIGDQGLVGRRGINAKGQVAGTIDAADGRLHAFVYDGEKMIDLGTMDGIGSEAIAINALGQATGWVTVSNETGASHAFLYDGTMHKLGTMGGNESYGQDINDRGQVTGYAKGADGLQHAFLYQNGVMSALPALGVRSWGTVINAGGTVAGWYDDPNAFGRSFVVDACHCPRDLGTLGGDQTVVFAINESGQMAGASEAASRHYHAFRYDKGTIQDLGNLGGDIAQAYSINASGWVTGFATTATNDTHAFVHDGTTMRDLGTLGGGYSDANVINASGQVVGSSYTAANEHHAMTWTEAGGMVDLNQVLHNPPPGLVLINAFTISDNGMIVAQGNPGLVLLKPRTGQQN